MPPLNELESQFQVSIENDRKRQLEDRLLHDIAHSNGSLEHLALKGVMTGLLSYMQYEDSHYYSEYRHKDGWFVFGSKDEEITDKRIRRLVVER